MSDLLPSLLSLTHHADPTLSVPATHAVGLVCDSSLSCGDVEGVLSGGVVEKVCSWVEVGKEVGKVLGLLRVVDKLCVGLKGALRSAQKQELEKKEKARQKETSGIEQRLTGQKEEESRDGWSLGSRCQSALDLMENTLLELCSARDSEEKESSAEMNVEVTEKVGGMLIRHFPHVVSGGRKEVGVIGVDVGGERREMKEREKQREEERRAEREKVEKMMEEMKKKEEEREREARSREDERDEEVKRREEERERRFELRMAELNEQAERHKRFIEEGEERERKKEEERRKVGAAAIEWFPADGYSLNGSVFTRTGGSCRTLLSAEFGNIVVRFTFTFQNISTCTRIGIVASALTAKAKGGSIFADLVGGAGWDLKSGCQYARQHAKEVQHRLACAAGRGGQRVVLEADGRDGKRTLRLSQDGQTQPTFFSRIHVPFRFAIWIGAGDAVSIESVEVVAEPQLSGGGTDIPMDEA
ncbi:hypothetical protein BLNAU_6097 [Blattamonas nauphoetae]|uniref:Uncharacterized protein n=1 Tax=Blattamonas nauphoetae TaxID=2049346 RepID=A0ABQ9Y530_9EUKA|nr:hypothetical protein BLNAU_6097 [Blattamonas nauphoetae]